MAIDAPLILAQVVESARSVIIYMMLIVVLVVVLIGAALLARRMMLGDEETAAGEGFTLSDLRALHARGELSDEQFDLARKKMIAQHRAMLLAERDGEGGASSSDKADGGDGGSDG